MPISGCTRRDWGDGRLTEEGEIQEKWDVWGGEGAQHASIHNFAATQYSYGLLSRGKVSGGESPLPTMSCEGGCGVLKIPSGWPRGPTEEAGIPLQPN